HRYSASRGIPNLRLAMANRYKALFNVDVDPDTEVVTTIGAKEGLTHLMWVLLGPGDSAIVPTPSYPIHLAGPGFAGANVITVPIRDPGTSSIDPGDDFFDGLVVAWENATVKPRVIICSFPHNPTSACVDLNFMTRLVEFALSHDVIICHDFAYADLGFDGYKPPSILQVPRAKECCVELYTLTKSFSMAGWRVGFLVGNAEIVAALTKLKSYLDYGTFQPVQIAAIVAMNEATEYPEQLRVIYQSRRDTLIDGLHRIGWHVTPPRGSMFIWAPVPDAYREMGSLGFAKYLIEVADVATSPGVGFGDGGDGHVRFALIENELRTGQAIRNLRKALPKLI
ncbi:MAG: aminotransferase class I/II-fold pyridoxal phosphate-dependent enzyme, partial [Acidimicrobiales bacterium]